MQRRNIYAARNIFALADMFRGTNPLGGYVPPEHFSRRNKFAMTPVRVVTYAWFHTLSTVLKNSNETQL